MIALKDFSTRFAAVEMTTIYGVTKLQYGHPAKEGNCKSQNNSRPLLTFPRTHLSASFFQLRM
ncbi:hypothetical protein QWY86_04240 [Pedobacter aquatilis]|nr:hypothetical protein [Pedobacter aquatilis]